MAAIAFFRPQHRFGAAAQEADAWPARVGVDEGDVAGGTRAVAVAAQDRPFDQLARDRIVDALLDIGRLRGPAAARSRNGILGGGHVDGGRARSGGPRHGFGRERLRRLGLHRLGLRRLGLRRWRCTGPGPGRNRWRRHWRPRDAAAGAARPISWRPRRPAVRRRRARPAPRRSEVRGAWSRSGSPQRCGSRATAQCCQLIRLTKH